MTEYRSPLSIAKGTGSAKEGAKHWFAQRITAIALIPLVLLSMFHFSTYDFSNFEESRKFMQNPIHAIGGILLYIAAFYHGSLGAQVIIEDYVSSNTKRTIIIILVKLSCFSGAALGIFSIFSIYLKG